MTIENFELFKFMHFELAELNLYRSGIVILLNTESKIRERITSCLSFYGVIS